MINKSESEHFMEIIYASEILIRDGFILFHRVLKWWLHSQMELLKNECFAREKHWERKQREKQRNHGRTVNLKKEDKFAGLSNFRMVQIANIEIEGYTIIYVYLLIVSIHIDMDIPCDSL